jgi:hypothetical protein
LEKGVQMYVSVALMEMFEVLSKTEASEVFITYIDLDLDE